MHTENTDDEFICHLTQSDIPQLKEFLESLDLTEENDTIRDFTTSSLPEGLWNIHSNNNEKMIIIIGVTKIYVILKKNNAFEKVQKKFLEMFPY